ncbi:ABC transporter permease [Candidatus Bathyarchaeota archaeon]|nr:ABC transporter permease [Candidatus Bathyarchaeota archaeon]
MNIRRIGVIAGKELKDALRDRRTILAMILIPIIVLPILMFLPMFLASPERNPVRVAVIQSDATSDDFLATLASTQVHIVRIGREENMTKLIQNGDYELGMVLPHNFSRILEGPDKTATITVFVDQSSTRGTIAFSLVQDAVTKYANKVVEERLAKTGLPPEALNPIETEVRTVSVTGAGAIFLVILLPLFLGIYAVTGAMYFIMDTTAGEKERKTLEALLTMPATRTEIVLGKFLIAVLIALLSSVLAILGMMAGAVFLVGAAGAGEPSAAGITISFTNLLLIGLATLVLAMTSASIEMVISIFARSFKEAQNLLSPLTLVVVVPTMAMQYMSEQTLRALEIAPILNAMLIIRDALLNKVAASNLAVELASAFVYMVIALAIAIKIFNSEKAMARY